METRPRAPPSLSGFALDNWDFEEDGLKDRGFEQDYF